jgi:hypothetical protein
LLVGWLSIVFVAGFFAKLMSVMFISVFGAPVALAALLIAVIAWRCWKSQRRRWPQIALLLACPLLVASILFTNWPMRLSFATSAPALDRLAEQVASGQLPILPGRAGVFTISSVETRPVSGGLAVCLWTSPLKRGHIGFVRSPAGITPQFNPWTHTKFSSRWHHFGED